jgi:hypothetical protein
MALLRGSATALPSSPGEQSVNEHRKNEGAEALETDPRVKLRPWTIGEVARLRALAAEGLRVGVIALRLQRTYDSVRTTARKEGIRFARFSSTRGKCASV